VLADSVKFAPRVGDVDNNLNRADAVLNKAKPEGLDLLVLPEMAFTGKLFLQHSQFCSTLNMFMHRVGVEYSLVKHHPGPCTEF
jgi:hypothetical protein